MAIEATETEAAELQLCQDIDSLNSQISELQTHLSSLKNQPTYELSPQNLTPAEVIQLAKKVAAAEQKAILQQAEAKAISHAIVSLESQVVEKRRQLGELKSKEAFDKLMGLAAEYNEAIDSSVRLLEAMKAVNSELNIQGHRPFEITADLIEIPYCQIHPNSVKVRRRYDVLRA